MSKPLRVLLVEDSEDDALLLLRNLKRGGYDPVLMRVDTSEGVRHALATEPWDVVLSDYKMHLFTGVEALNIVQKSGLDLPFILISGYINEEAAVEAMKAGAHDYISKSNLARLVPAIERELKDVEVRRARRRAEEELFKAYAELERRVEERTAELQKEIAERKRVEEEMKHLAHHDALTGLPNRRLFMDILDLELAKTRRNQGKFAVLFLDLDRFKCINDTLGHDIGDELLKEVAERLRHSIRGSDIVSRIGGDEFNILLADIVHAEDISSVAKKIIDSFKRPFRAGGHELHTSTSIGVSIYPDDAPDMESLFRNADIAMYHAKELGGNTYQFYDSAMNIRTVERMKLESWLRQSLNFGELEVYYQPQITTDTRQVVCAEALVRWRHPEQGLLDPEHFIPLAEETGFITAIDEWVLRTACAQFKEWQDAGLPPLCVTVNLSAKQFQKFDLVERIARILQETGLDPRQLDLEITESVAMKNIEHTVPNMTRLSEMGVGIAIDDFGTGYSSLNYLKKLPIHKLKIDQSFVRDIATNNDDRTIVKAVAALAQNMKLRVIAEGVETEEQLEFLRSIGCHEMQGFLFSRPLPADEFRELITSDK